MKIYGDRFGEFACGYCELRAVSSETITLFCFSYQPLTAPPAMGLERVETTQIKPVTTTKGWLHAHLMNRCVWLEKNRYRVLCSFSNGFVQAERCFMKWRSNAKITRSLQIRCVMWRCVKELVALLGFRNLVRITIDCIFTLSRDFMISLSGVE